MRPRALDLFCGAGGMSEGLRRAGFDVVGVDLMPQPHHRGGEFVRADALTFPLEGFAFIHASPPCQAHTTLRHLHPEREYPCFIDAIRERLRRSGIPWSIENVPGAPLARPPGGSLVMLCGTMFGLQTPDGRAEIRRHRLFELSFSVPLVPACQHGGVGSLSVTGHGAEVSSGCRVICVAGGKAMAGGMREPMGTRARRAMTVTGNTAQTNTVRNTVRETFTTDDARAAMGIDWMPMKSLSQAIPPAYGEWIGRQALEVLGMAP